MYVRDEETYIRNWEGSLRHPVSICGNIYWRGTAESRFI